MSSNQDPMTLTPRVLPDTNIFELSLNAKDGYLLAQIDGLTSAEVLVDVVGSSPDELLQTLRRLEAAGAIVFEHDGRAPRAPAPVSAAETALSPQERALLESAGGLSDEERAALLGAEALLGEHQYWLLLGLSGSPNASDVKRAYFLRSKEFHPDRYFGRQLGPDKARLERVFAGIKRAYDVLGDGATRKQYEARHPPPAAAAIPPPEAQVSSPPAAEDDAAKKARLEARRAEILASRRAKRRAGGSPASKGDPDKAEAMYQAGLGQLGQGDVVAAAKSFRLAVTYNPDNSVFAQQLAEVEGEAKLRRARQLTDEADAVYATGDMRSAARMRAEAADACPDKASLALEAARAFSEIGEWAQAIEYAGRVISRDAAHLEACIVLVQALAGQGNRKAALAELERAESLDPTDPRVKKLHKTLHKATG